MRIRDGVLIAVFAVTFFWAAVASAQDGSQRDLTEIIASGKLLVAMVDGDYPPFIIPGKDGRLAGLEVEQAKALADELGVAMEIVKVASFNDVIEKVAAGQADIGLSNLSVTSKRALKVKFTDPYRKLGYVLLLNRMKMAANDLEAGMQHLSELKNTTETIGVIGRSSYEAVAIKNFPKAKIKAYELYRDMIQDTEKGELLLALGNSGTFDDFLKQSPHLKVKLQPFKIEGRYDHIAMAVGVNSDHLLSWLNAYLLSHDLTAR